MKILNIFLLSSLITSSVLAQNITDVVRWSATDPAGSARVMGVGSAFGAMGGDFSVININPAGIGDYRISEFVFSPSLTFNRSDAYFVGDPTQTERYKKSRIGIENIGFVIAGRRSGSTWTASNFAIGFSRIANFNENILLRGATKGSMTRMFAERANTLREDDLDDFVAYPALFTGAIFDNNNDLNYETDFDEYPETRIPKSQEIIRSGGINEFTFGWAGEYQKRLNIGVSVGVPFGSFEEDKFYDETDPANNIPAFNSLNYVERLTTSGVGVNFKLGMTYKIDNVIRLGAAIHSPSWFRFTDNYSTSMRYSFVDAQGLNQTFNLDSPDGTFRYRINGPWRAVGSLGTIYNVGEIKGFINADIEYVDYTSSYYNGAAYTNDPGEVAYTNEVNRNIQSKLSSGVNLRLGTEMAYQSLRLRAGYSWEKSPFNADDFLNNSLSLGLGIREDKFFIDMAVRLTERSTGYNPYVVLDDMNNPLSVINTTRTRGVLTLGFKF